jgi:hypothetical protein
MIAKVCKRQKDKNPAGASLVLIFLNHPHLQVAGICSGFQNVHSAKKGYAFYLC